MEFRKLTVLVTDLVDLARGDEPADVKQDVRLDLVVEDAVERARRHAFDKRFSTDLQPSLVLGVPGRLDRAIRLVTRRKDFELYGSGRTDAGVHALAQVAHLEPGLLVHQ